MPWQRDLLDLALEIDPKTGHLAYREVRLTVPRQSGKTTLILVKNIWRMVDAAALGGRQKLVYTAQTRKDARAKFVDDFIEELAKNPRVKGRYRPRLATGDEAIRWGNGSLWMLQSTTEKSGHGGTLDGADLDESFAHVDDRIEQALSPAMITRPDAQLWVLSTAGTERSIYLNQKVESGRLLAETGVQDGVCYVEYSAPDDADPYDEDLWATYMPALGHTVTRTSIRAELMRSLPVFKRAYMNHTTVENEGEQAIASKAWAECRDPGSQIIGSDVVFAVDVAYSGAWSSIAVAGMNGEGLPQGEVTDNRQGDQWVVPRLVELRERWGRRPVVLDEKSAAAALLPDLRAAGIEPITTNAMKMAQACAQLKSLSEQGAWRHIGQPILTDALAGAATRQLLDSWAWRRVSSACDISPLVAVTLAVWALRNTEVPLAPTAIVLGRR